MKRYIRSSYDTVFYLIEVKSGSKYSYVGENSKHQVHQLNTDTDNMAWEIKEYGFRNLQDAKLGVRKLKRMFDRNDISYDSVDVRPMTVKFKDEAEYKQVVKASRDPDTNPSDRAEAIIEDLASRITKLHNYQLSCKRLYQKSRDDDSVMTKLADDAGDILKQIDQIVDRINER